MKTYVRATTAKELREQLLDLMQGEAWRQLCTEAHPATQLIKEAAQSLKD